MLSLMRVCMCVASDRYRVIDLCLVVRSFLPSSSTRGAPGAGAGAGAGEDAEAEAEADEAEGAGAGEGVAPGLEGVVRESRAARDAAEPVGLSGGVGPGTGRAADAEEAVEEGRRAGE